MERRQFLVAGALAGATVVAGPGRALAAPVVAPGNLTADDQSQIRSLIGSYLQARADAVTARGRALTTDSWRSNVTRTLGERIGADLDRLAETRQLTERVHGGYSSSDVSVRLGRTRPTAAGLTVSAEEMTKIRYARTEPGDAEACQQRLDHEFEVVRSESGWKLAEARFLSHGGVPPLTQFFDAPVARSGGVPRPAVPRSSVPSVGARRKEIPAAKGGTGSVPALASYNYQAMANYAVNWAYGRNGNYPNYHNVGGDCTNFVSQCMEAGGWQTITGADKTQRNVWFHYGTNPSSCSYTWGGAEPWYWFACYYSRRTYILEYTYQLAMADVMQYDFGGDDTIDHTQICHGFAADGDQYIAQHDDDYSYVRFSEVLARVQAGNPNCLFYAHRT